MVKLTWSLSFAASIAAGIQYCSVTAFIQPTPLPVRDHQNHQTTTAVAISTSSVQSSSPLPIELSTYLTSRNVNPELSDVIVSVAEACSEISQNLSTPSFFFPTKEAQEVHTVNVQGETQTPMDIVANDIFLSKVSPNVAYLASEEEVGVIAGCAGMKYEIAFDPLDGSSNVDVNIPTGSIFGIYPSRTGEEPFKKPGTDIVAAGYALYSSSLQFVLSLGPSGRDGAAIFTLYPPTNTFLLTQESLMCPKNGPYYSLNDAREPDWPDGLSRWIYDAKRGNTPSKTVFSARYVCSLVADVHRTFLKGGWAGNPRPHLRLLYEAAPLSHVAEACAGRGSDGVRRILDIVPGGLHDRVPVFIGSEVDVIELEEYGDVQQLAKSYDA